MSILENEDFIPLSEFLEEMGSIDFYFKERFLDTDVSMSVEQLRAESPCQLLIEIDQENNIKIGAIPPMYYVETTIMPFFHKIKLTIVKE